MPLPRDVMYYESAGAFVLAYPNALPDATMTAIIRALTDRRATFAPITISTSKPDTHHILRGTFRRPNA